MSADLFALSIRLTIHKISWVSALFKVWISDKKDNLIFLRLPYSIAVVGDVISNLLRSCGQPQVSD